jgi:phage FluMu protein Com
MITLRCNGCGQVLNLADNAVGKRVKCRECGSIISIPSEKKPLPVGTKEKNRNGILLSDSRRQFLTRIMPLWVWGVILGCLVVMVIGLGFNLGLRDTWERDHYAEIKSLDDQASRATYSGNAKEGLETYERLFQLVGTRVLKGAARTIVESAKTIYADAQDKYEEQLLASMTPVAEDATVLYRQQEYGQALDKYTLVYNTLIARPVYGNKIKQFFQSVENAKQLTLIEVQKIQEQQRQEEAKRQSELAEQAEQQAERVVEEMRSKLVTKKKYDMLHTDSGSINTSYFQAIRIIGSEGKLIDDTEVGGKANKTYRWENPDGSTMTLMFEDDVLTLKNQEGLK